MMQVLDDTELVPVCIIVVDRTLVDLVGVETQLSGGGVDVADAYPTAQVPKVVQDIVNVKKKVTQRILVSETLALLKHC